MPILACSPSAPLRSTSRRENFWFIVAARSEDETEIRTGQAPTEQVLKDIRRQTRRRYQAFREEKRKAAQQLELPFVTIIRKL